jgi:hypothetical protein
MADQREFKKLLKGAGREVAKEAQDWFRDTAKNVGENKKDPSKLFTPRTTPSIGEMFLYVYDPKTKDKLPFWDSYPLTVIVEMYSDGFLGLNLHYLPPVARAQLMDALNEVKNNDKYNESTKIMVSYKILKAYTTQFKGFESCLKRYLFGHVRSAFHYVHPKDWGKVVMLPLQKWHTNTNRRYAGSPPY